MLPPQAFLSKHQADTRVWEEDIRPLKKHKPLAISKHTYSAHQTAIVNAIEKTTKLTTELNGIVMEYAWFLSGESAGQIYPAPTCGSGVRLVACADGILVVDVYSPAVLGFIDPHATEFEFKRFERPHPTQQWRHV